MLGQVNRLALEVVRLSGGVVADKHRDYRILTCIPDLKERLLGWAAQCDGLHTRLLAYASANDCRLFQELTNAAACSSA